MNQHLSRILVTGATGYVGGRLVPRLLEAGYPVRVLVRDRSRLQGRAWVDEVEVFEGDVTRPLSLTQALTGAECVYYLVHGMEGGEGFEDRDVRVAGAFAAAVRDAGVGRLVYLGGLGDPAQELSPHLRSRQQTGAALAEAAIPVTEFRAAVIVGSGSISFEMIRYLSERVPLMVCPRWVYTKIQPIAVEDVLAYLVAAAASDQEGVIEVGGADVLTYGEMMLGYARARGLRRWLLPVPVLSPRLSSYWVHWVTPVPASIARPLIEGLRNEVIVRDARARELFPHIVPVSYQEALRQALETLQTGEVETSWCDAVTTSIGDRTPVCLVTEQGMVVERRDRVTSAPASALYRVFTGLGGERGWPGLAWSWRVRGAMDRLVGGVGLRRGRRHPDEVRVGDAVDFWRVEAVEKDRLLRLRAEMKLPGRAWLEFQAVPLEDGGARLVQKALFAPSGLAGIVYWYALYPLHKVIFSLLAAHIVRRAEGEAGSS